MNTPCTETYKNNSWKPPGFISFQSSTDQPRGKPLNLKIDKGFLRGISSGNLTQAAKSMWKEYLPSEPQWDATSPLVRLTQKSMKCIINEALKVWEGIRNISMAGRNNKWLLCHGNQTGHSSKCCSIEITHNQTILLLGILLQRFENMLEEKLVHDCL